MAIALKLDLSTRLYGVDNHDESCVVLFFRRRLPLRDIIGEKVLAEVAKAREKQVHYVSTRYLTDEDLSWVKDGALKPTPREIDPERETEKALEAFRKQRYFVFVDGSRRDDLDEMIPLTAETKIQFVRVMPLVGGECWVD